MTDYSTILPTAEDTWFLRACLDDATGAHQAWTMWLGASTADGTPARRALARVNALLPLLAWNLGRTSAPVDRSVQTHLRSASLTEELRWQRYRDICESAFTRLGDAGIPFIGLKGAVVGARFYPAAVLRHADDIDVLVGESDIARAADTFVAAGWRQGAPPIFRQPLHVPALIHDADVSVELHRRLVIPHFTMPHEQLWERAQTIRIGNTNVSVLATPDALLHTLAHAMQSTRDLRWAADAWFMARTLDAGDWPTFTATTIAARLALPVHAALAYLVEHLSIPVPPDVLIELTRAAAQATFLDRQAARPWPVGRVFPPPVQFALHYDVPVWTVPFCYLYRLGRHVVTARTRRNGTLVRAR